MASANRPRVTARPSAGAWVVEPTPSPGPGPYADLTGVSCVRSFCAAVGYTTNAATFLQQPLSEMRHSGVWTIAPVPLPSGSVGGSLARVSCTASGFCVAVGQWVNASFGLSEPLAESWNGSGWVIEPTPLAAGAGTGSLSGVSCSSGRACTAVGFGGLMHGAEVALVERWNGSDWSLQATPGQASWVAVSCPSERDCTAVGDNGGSDPPAHAGQWNGSSWSLETTSDPNGVVTDVSCTSRDSCTLVGSDQSTTLAERWNGSSWTTQTTLNPFNPGGDGSQLRGISCASRRNCTAVGYSEGTLVEQWNGEQWSVQPTPTMDTTSSTLGAISCTRWGPCIAVGTYTEPNSVVVPLVELRRGGSGHGWWRGGLGRGWRRGGLGRG